MLSNVLSYHVWGLDVQQRCTKQWKKRERKKDRQRNTNRGREEEKKSGGRAGYNRILTTLRISQHTQQKKPKDTNTHHAFVILWEWTKTTKQDKNSKTPQRKGRRAWWLFPNCKTVITRNPRFCCLTHSNNKSRQHQMTSHIFCFVQGT